MMFGANPAAVQRILRHSDIRVTMDVYGHLAPGYLRTEIDRLSFRPKSDRFTSRVLQASPEGDLPLLSAPEPANDSRDLSESGREDLNLRHSAPKNGGRDRRGWAGVASSRKDWRRGGGGIAGGGCFHGRFERFCYSACYNAETGAVCSGDRTSGVRTAPRSAGAGVAHGSRSRGKAAGELGDGVSDVRARRDSECPRPQLNPRLVHRHPRTECRVAHQASVTATTDTTAATYTSPFVFSPGANQRYQFRPALLGEFVHLAIVDEKMILKLILPVSVEARDDVRDEHGGVAVFPIQT